MTIIHGQDIGFHVEYVNPSGDVTLILPYRRYVSDQLQIVSAAFEICLQSLRYKVDAVPPVVDTPPQDLPG
ncbi:hypothetical protein B296_00053820 [Ensete ventricosum]|uniref:Uncharacterized protein n=1 Tax=Ensete ventricosum TaxID=4639 RepID=A0A426XF46_ENSVE|nr:hypothetical protein B296_00053820 [Ensete ventricosum]